MSYIAFSGIEGVGKTTQVAKLKEALAEMYGQERICVTSEPGSKHALLTMELRKLMLDAAWDDEMTKDAREYISQAARSVNLNGVVLPALAQKKIVIQDRSLLCGFSYGMICGHSKEWLDTLTAQTCKQI